MLYTVALIDDHHLMRTGLAATVNSVGGYTVTLEAGNGREFIRALSGMDEPRIAIVDLFMPIMDGFETIAWLKQNTPQILPLALTFDASDDVMVRAVRAGARGFLLKNARPPILKVALDSLILTGYYHSDELHETLVEKQNLKTPYEKQQEKILAQITPRELEFLKLVCAAEEYTYEQIADKMGVHRRTVDGFREGLVEKFGIKSKTGLVLFAMRWKVVQP
jgi:two-component system, NarL family, invasion response regulator UvrY